MPPTGDILSGIVDNETANGPPLATVPRRAASNSALDDAARAQGQKEKTHSTIRKRAEKRRLVTEAEVLEEYSDIERALHNHGNAEYQ